MTIRVIIENIYDCGHKKKWAEDHSPYYTFQTWFTNYNDDPCPKCKKEIGKNHLKSTTLTRIANNMTEINKLNG